MLYSSPLNTNLSFEALENVTKWYEATVAVPTNPPTTEEVEIQKCELRVKNITYSKKTTQNSLKKILGSYDSLRLLKFRFSI